MSPDPYASGDVGLIPALLFYILFAWITRAQKKRISKAEEVAFDVFSYITVFVLMFPIHLMMGFLIVGAGVIVSPIIEVVSGLDVKAFVRIYIWADGSFLSYVWTAVIGALPSTIVLFEDWLKRRKKD